MSHDEVHRELATAKAQQAEGRFAEALDTLERAAKTHPQHASPRFALGSLLRSMARFEEAWAHIDAAGELEPRNVWLMHERALTAIAEGDWTHAARIYQHAVDRMPNVLHRTEFAIALAECGYHRAAWDLLWEATTENASHQKMWRTLLRICARLRCDEAVVSVVDRALEHHAEDVGLRTLKVDSLARLGFFAAALEELEWVRATGRGDGYVENRSREYGAALEAQMSQDRVKTYVDGMFAGAEARMFDAAAKHCSYVKDPTHRGDARKLVNLSMSLMAMDRRLEAMHFAMEAYRANPTIDPYARQLLCALLWSNTFPEGTLKNLRRARKADIFRLLYIYKHGGIYVDADDRCAIPLDGWLLNDSIDLVLTYSADPSSYIHNWFIAARPRHPALGRAIHLMMQSVSSAMSRGQKANIWEETGPGCLTRGFLDWVCRTFEAGDLSAFEKVVLLPEIAFRSVVRWKTDLEYRKMPDKHWTKA